MPMGTGLRALVRFAATWIGGSDSQGIDLALQVRSCYPEFQIERWFVAAGPAALPYPLLAAAFDPSHAGCCCEMQWSEPRPQIR